MRHAIPKNQGGNREYTPRMAPTQAEMVPITTEATFTRDENAPNSVAYSP